MKKTNAMRQLEAARIAYDIQEYAYDPENLDVGHIADENGLLLPQIFKTLVCKGDKTGVVIAVVSGDKQLNLKALAAASGNKKMAMAPVKDLQALTGYLRGGCSPIGMKKNHPVIVDRAAEAWEKIYVNAGARGLLIGLDPGALLAVTGGVFANVGE